ncbi:sulfatase [Alteromonas sp. KUL49]|uniref:sulfatase family protein n=1 Tax=Alteromonas sp. KUL49 TaxID=2480798 RepID=UPI00102F1532|nr:sulfatase [Alteromonas sp. KUL49]TAP39429.1 heparan N-sulfatase [Alteromonas sp. KUL49]GEA12228.1 heparan N-sulfatase [Alteromonas sp. KUL49]
MKLIRAKVFLVITTCILSVIHHSSFANDRPNIVLMVADDHGREAIGVYGNPLIQTPNIDALADVGLKFDHAYATSASCSASRSVLLTGLHNHANGQYGHAHSYHHFSTHGSVIALPTRLKNAGYRTAQVGKFHLAPTSTYAFEQRLQAPYAKPNGERDSEGMATAAIPLIQETSEKPFFLYLATNDPHRSGDINSTGDNIFGNVPDDSGEGIARLGLSMQDVVVPSYLPDLPSTRRELAELYASISRVDKTLGILVDELKRAGEYENTVIIYLSDNGTAMPGAKTTVYDPGIRLPLIIKPAGKYEHKGSTTQAMVSWTDITPTILSLASVDVDGENFHGRSFSEVIESPTNTHGWDKVFSSHTFHEVTMYYPMRSVRTPKYKLIMNIASGLTYPFASDLQVSSTWQEALTNVAGNFGARSIESYLHRPKFELYDVSTEKGEVLENENLIDHPDYQSVFEELSSQLIEFQQQTNDPWLYKWEYE